MRNTMFKLLLEGADKGAGGGEGGAGDKGAGDKGGQGGDGKGGDKGADGAGDKGGDKGAGDKSGSGGGDKGAGDKAGKGGSDDKGGDKGGDGKAGAGAPEKYELKLPDDQEYLDDSDVKAIEVIARGKGWTNEQAQAALDEHVAAIDAQKARFLDETKSDPKIGGKNFDASVALANKALDRLAPKGDAEGDRFRKMLAKSGYGNNVAVVGFLARLGKMMAEDGTLVGGGGGGEKKSAEEVMYGGTTSKSS